MRNSTNDRARAERTSKEWNDKHMLKKKTKKKNKRTDERFHYLTRQPADQNTKELNKP